MEIKFINTSCKEDNYTVLRNLNFVIEDNKITGIVGQNKTALIELIMGVRQIFFGELFIGDYLIQDLDTSEIKRDLALVSQNIKESFYTDRVLDEMKFTINNMEYYGDDVDTRIEQALDMCGLDTSYLNRKISDLSSGEKKLLQFAVALLCNPKVLILDEPFAYLDYSNTKKMINLIKLLKERYNKTIIISTNDTNMLFELSDNTVILANDTAIVEGPSDEILATPELLHKYNIYVPDIIEFSYRAKKKNDKIHYHRDIRDLIKDVYKHV